MEKGSQKRKREGLSEISLSLVLCHFLSLSLSLALQQLDSISLSLSLFRYFYFSLSLRVSFFLYGVMIAVNNLDFVAGLRAYVATVLSQTVATKLYK